jgi:hypothetical protein
MRARCLTQNAVEPALPGHWHCPPVGGDAQSAARGSGVHTRSITVAMPMPPPTHSVANP